MSRIARRALLPSLIATAALVTQGAAAPRTCAQGAGAATGVARPASATRCPTCERHRHLHGAAARDLLADGGAVLATESAVRSLLGAGPEDAEEAAQEAALRAVAKDLEACCDRGLERWLFRTAKNYLLDVKRKKREILLGSLREETADLAVPPSPEIGPQQIAALSDQVAAALERFDVGAMTTDKKVQLGRALGDRLQEERSVRHYLPKAGTLVDAAPDAVEAIRPHS